MLTFFSFELVRFHTEAQQVRAKPLLNQDKHQIGKEERKGRGFKVDEAKRDQRGSLTRYARDH